MTEQLSPQGNYRWPFIGLMAAFAILFLIVSKTAPGIDSTALRALWAASPILPLIGAAAIFILSLTRLDELQLRIQILALSITSGVVTLSLAAYGLIGFHVEVPAFDLPYIMPYYVIVWAITTLIVARRFT